MHSVLISLVVFTCTFGGALFGMFLHSILPKEHLQPGTTDVVKLATGLVVTMTGLVLGMLVSSSLTFYNTQHREIQDLSAKLILTDRILSEYGPETREIRSNLHDVVAIAANRIWPEDRSLRTDLKPDHTFANVYGELQALPPKNEQQRTNRAEALGLMRAIYETRWLMFVESSGNALSTPLLTILVSWLTVIFISFGLLAQRNATLTGTLIVCSLAVSAAVFIIVEMYDPFEGLFRMSATPMRSVLEQIGR